MTRAPVPERQEPAHARRTNGEASLIDSLNQQKAYCDVRLADKQQGLHAKFAGMGAAFSELQSQGRWLSGQLSGLSANTG